MEETKPAAGRSYILDVRCKEIYERDKQRRLSQCSSPRKVDSPRSRRIMTALPRLLYIDPMLGQCTDVGTALLVSKGPTLDIERIRKIRPHTHMMATLQTADTLAGAGICPDAYVVCDPQDIMVDRWLPYVGNSMIFADVMTDPRFMCDGRVCYYTQPSPHLVDMVVQRAGMYRIPYITYTVSETMYCIALALGFKRENIVLNGVDYYYDTPIGRPPNKMEQQIKVDGVEKWSYVDYICGLHSMLEISHGSPRYLEQCADADFVRRAVLFPSLFRDVKRYRRARAEVMKYRKAITSGIEATIPSQIASLAEELGARVEDG